MATLSYSGASFTFPNLTAPPLGLDTSDATKGRAAETVTFTGLLRKAQTDNLWSLCRAWRVARLPEEPAIRTGALGATIAVTASGPGFSWTSRPCWITDGPSQDAAGSLIRVSLTLVDAEREARGRSTNSAACVPDLVAFEHPTDRRFVLGAHLQHRAQFLAEKGGKGLLPGAQFKSDA